MAQIKVLGLEHISLVMPEGAEDQARAFYTGLLGLEELEKPEGLKVHGGCWFSLGAQALHLGVSAEFAPARKAHPAFVVKDLGVAREVLGRAGVAVHPDSQVPGVRRFYADDPFGNRLEFIQAGDRF